MVHSVSWRVPPTLPECRLVQALALPESQGRPVGGPHTLGFYPPSSKYAKCQGIAWDPVLCLQAIGVRTACTGSGFLLAKLARGTLEGACRFPADPSRHTGTCTCGHCCLQSPGPTPLGRIPVECGLRVLAVTVDWSPTPERISGQELICLLPARVLHDRLPGIRVYHTPPFPAHSVGGGGPGWCGRRGLTVHGGPTAEP